MKNIKDSKSTEIKIPIFGEGEMSNLIRSFNWSSTSLGPITEWANELLITVNTMLQSPIPMVLLWGEEGILLYNDAYAIFAGARHPFLLGQKVLEGWPEVSEFNQNVLRNGFLGQTLSFKDQQLTLYRNNIAEEVWLDLNYSPVLNKYGKPSGILAIVVETTQQVLAQRRQKVAEENLKNEQQMLYSLFLNAPAAIAILNGSDLVYKFANESYKSLVGGSKREFLNRPLTEVFPEIEENIHTILKNVAFKGERFIASELPITLDWNNTGNPFTKYLNFVYEPVYENGKPNGVISFAFDISNTVISKKQAEDSEAKLRAILEATPHCIKIVEPDGTLQYMNASGLKLLEGMSEVLGIENVFNLIAPEDIAEWKKNHDFVCKGNKLSWRFDMKGYEGQQHKMETHAVPLWDGEKFLHVAVTRDITDQHQFEETLKQSEAKMRDLANAMPQLVWAANPDGTVDYYNNNVLDFEGIVLIDGQYHWTPVLHEEDLEKTVNAWNEAMKNGNTYEIEHRVKIKNKGFRWFLSRAVPAKDENGNLIKWYGTATDIDDIKKFEEQLKIAQEDTNLLMAKKDEFIGIASHELKTPLTTIKASLQIVQGLLKEQNYELTQQLISKTESNVDKLTGLINDLLNVSKIQSGHLQLNYTTFFAKDLVESCLDQISFQTKNHQIEIKGNSNKVIMGDKYRLEQVLCNLITNAIKYSTQGKQVILETKNDDTHFEVSVTDFGIGIPSHKLPFIFDKFFRVEKNSMNYQGLGLGLHIAKEIVERHGGTISAKSEEGKGSCFSFKVPLTATN
jgi:two-component system, chemotaxis family, CheB/CheR fusion protein